MTGQPALVKIGLLRLTDAATVIVASARGLFDRHGLAADLSVEPSWANIADKLAFGLLDAAVMLPPLAMAASLGLRGRRTDLVVPMALSQGGNSVTVSPALASHLAYRCGPDAAILDRGAALGEWARLARDRGGRPRLAVVHLYSNHTLLLRYWLAASGVDPDHDVELVVIPPSQMVDRLALGEVCGFCAGAPWGVLAERAGAGRVIALGSEIWSRHPEKVLAVRADWAERQPAALSGLLRALTEAAAICDDPGESDPIASLLSDPHLVGADPASILTSLGGSQAAARRDADRIGFFANAATMPWTSQAAWFAAQMAGCGWIAPGQAAEAASIYRPDLYRLAGTIAALPLEDAKPEGGHAAAWSLDTETGSPIPMLPDLFCDDAVFGIDGRRLPPR